tara:strand:+ start:337 stop:489 length:153 start_codon:yes stop_codon:yes gene_type:complete
MLTLTKILRNAAITYRVRGFINTGRCILFFLDKHRKETGIKINRKAISLI